MDIWIRVSTWSWHRAVSVLYFGGLTVVGDVVFYVGPRSDFVPRIAATVGTVSCSLLRAGC